MQQLDDIVLLREYVEHDSEEAFATLVTRHINKVYSVALRHTGNPHQAEEITQAVFVILATKSRALEKRVVLSGWLCQTARLTALTFIRNEARRSRREQEAHMRTVLNQNESDVWGQVAPLLDAAMAGLSKADHHAVVLRFFDGKSMREVGTALGASEDAAKMRVNRAVGKMRLFFTKRGVVVSPVALTTAISANSVQAAPAALAKTAITAATAKGATTASSSTLTLTKGALKIMAWTKLKTGIVTGAIVLLAVGTTTIVVKEIRSPNDLRNVGPRTTAATEKVRGQLFHLADLIDAGNTTPEAAWESRYWARAMGDYDAVVAGTDPQAFDGAKAWMGDKATFRAGSKEEFASFQGFQILARKDLASDRVELKYQFAFQNSLKKRQETKIVLMVKVNGAWRCLQTRGYDASWDADSQPEPEA